MITFGVGVWLSAGQNRALRFVGGFLIGKEVLGFMGTLFAPIHLCGVETTLTGSMHTVIRDVGVLLILLAIGFGAAALGKRFRLYSIATLLVLLVFGTLAGLEAPRMVANLPTPWLGVWERINVFGYMLWVVVLAIALLGTPVQRLQPSLKRSSG